MQSDICHFIALNSIALSLVSERMFQKLFHMRRYYQSVRL